jgi:hypothetical protein
LVTLQAKTEKECERTIRRGMSGKLHSTLGGVGLASGGMDVRYKGFLVPFQEDERDTTQLVIRKKGFTKPHPTYRQIAKMDEEV